MARFSNKCRLRLCILQNTALLVSEGLFCYCLEPEDTLGLDLSVAVAVLCWYLCIQPPVQCKKHRQVQCVCVSKEMKPICQQSLLLLPGGSGSASGMCLWFLGVLQAGAGSPAGFTELPAEPLGLCLCHLEF